MKKRITIVLFCFISSATFSQDINKFMTFNFGVNTAKVIDSPHKFVTGLDRQEMQNQGLAASISYYHFFKNEPSIGFNVNIGMYTLGFDTDKFVGNLESKNRINPILTVGPVFKLVEKGILILFEPSIGFVGGVHPYAKATYLNGSTDERDYIENKPKIGYTIGLSANKVLSDKWLVSISGNYFKGGAEGNSTFVSADNTGRVFTDLTQGPIEHEFDGFIIEIGIGLLLGQSN